MKILGVTETTPYSNRVYIVEVSESELKQAFEKGYDDYSFAKLKSGDEISLAGIPNQRLRIISAINAMSVAYESFVKAAPVMADVVRVITAANQKANIQQTD